MVISTDVAVAARQVVNLAQKRARCEEMVKNIKRKLGNDNLALAKRKNLQARLKRLNDEIIPCVNNQINNKGNFIKTNGVKKE